MKLKVKNENPLTPKAGFGALEGATHTSRETVMWTPSVASTDGIINGSKLMADARSRDMVMNDGYAAGISSLHKDSIVGSSYFLNSKPAVEVLKRVFPGATEAWADEFQIAVETRFNLIAESANCFFDAQGVNTFSGLIRLGLASYVMSGEVLASVEWLREQHRPFKTAILHLSPDRLSNPNMMPDSQYLRRGIERNMHGKPLAYHIQNAHPYDMLYGGPNALTWKRVPARKPWGRLQMIHIYDTQMVDQSRGISQMVAVLKQMRMTKRFQEIVLQNAVVNASYAASIESELPTHEVFAALGANTGGTTMAAVEDYFGTYMGIIGEYMSGARNISIDGTKIPHLPPGSKLNMQPIGTPGGVGTEFETSLLRHIAASLNISYEEFAQDYTKSNYSSARASMNNTFKSMQAKKANIADREASSIFNLWLEEELNAGNLPMFPGFTLQRYYSDVMVREAIHRCSWIGASRGQIDEMKETQAAILRIRAGLSTYEAECARLGFDYREIYKQRKRENTTMQVLGLDFALSPAKEDANTAGNGTTSEQDDNSNKPSTTDE